MTSSSLSSSPSSSASLLSLAQPPPSSTSVSDVSFTESHFALSITNVSDRPAAYSICNDSVFFVVQDVPRDVNVSAGVGTANSDGGDGSREATTGSSRNIAPCSSHTVLIRVNPQAIAHYRSVLAKEKYVEEHITVYNRNHLNEKYWVCLRLSFGNYLDFASAPVPSVLRSLESEILFFLREFNEFWHKITLRTESELAFGVSVESARSAGRRSRSGSGVAASSLEADPTSTTPNTSTTVAAAPGPAAMSASATACAPLEEAIGLEEALLGALSDPVEGELFYHYVYVTDQLIRFSLKKQAGQRTLPLANLLFSVMFQHPMFSVGSSRSDNLSLIRRKWVSKLDEFLTYHPRPSNHNAESSLRRLRASVNRRNAQDRDGDDWR